MNNLKTLKIAVVMLSVALLFSIGVTVYLLLQTFWWRKTVDDVAEIAGAAQAMSTFRHGHLVLWEIETTNTSIRYSGRHDGPFEVWLDEYQPEMPAPWQYSRRKLDEAHNAQMRYMFDHPKKFRDETQPAPKGTNSGIP